jgi:hypothetical protein
MKNIIYSWSKHTKQQEEAPSMKENTTVMGLHIEH